MRKKLLDGNVLERIKIRVKQKNDQVDENKTEERKETLHRTN